MRAVVDDQNRANMATIRTGHACVGGVMGYAALEESHAAGIGVNAGSRLRRRADKGAR